MPLPDTGRAPNFVHQAARDQVTFVQGDMTGICIALVAVSATRRGTPRWVDDAGQ